MDANFARSLYRLVPFMFLIHILGAGSFFLVGGFAGGLDLMGVEVPGLAGTCVILPFAFALTVITLWFFPLIKSELFGMLLMISTTILNGVLAIQALTVLYTLFSWLN